MASRPGILTEWPWTFLGNFKYLVMAPFVIHSTYSYYMAKENGERDLTNLIIFPFLLTRMAHNQLWISWSRYRTAKGSNRIVDKSIEFEQVDRERNWDDQIIFNGILFYVGYYFMESSHHLPWWRADGVVWTILLHAGPVEFLYYWLHRALHHHFLYSRYHSHHHASIATEPITSVVHPFGEHIAYFMLFAIPLLTTILKGTASVVQFASYITYIDFMNNMGHCNFEHIPKRLFNAVPPLKYLMYTPSYHSLHHTKFRTNYSLFMPFYDYLYDTVDGLSDSLHEGSLAREDDVPDVVHLTHLTSPESVDQLRLGFASLAAEPHGSSRWYLWLAWPVTLWSMTLARVYGRVFVVERNVFGHVRTQTWAVPKYSIQYCMGWLKESINAMINDAVVEAEEKGVKVLSLGLLNQDEGLNRSGELYLKKNPRLKVKLVDGSSLAVAVVLNSIPKTTSQVVLRGRPNKVAFSIALALCKGGIRVHTVVGEEYNALKAKLDGEAGDNLVVLSDDSKKLGIPKIWLVGDGLTEEDQAKASKGSLFVPFSQFPPKKAREDCSYATTPAMRAPKHLENVDSCENWLPRRVMSAWRVAGILHAVEEWGVHECGNATFDVEKIWRASLKHGFRPMDSRTAIES